MLPDWLRDLFTRDSARPDLPLPPRRNNHEGAERRVGVELEFTGLGIERIARLLRETLGGEIDPQTPYEYTVNNTKLGDFGVELDYAYLKSLGRRDQGEGEAPGELERLSEDMLAAVAKQVVPFEIVSPPLPVSRLAELEPLVTALRTAGARGTGESPLYGFGLHLNPELPGLDAVTVRDYLRAYSVLFDWLRQVSALDFSRRIFPYIQPYPKDYVRLLMQPDYAPDRTGLIDDYLAHNPSRNRALDMLPLFAFLDEARVRAALEDARINARPTLHYRLPNCEIERADWNIGVPWRHWLRVEHLANRPDRLAEACAAYDDHLGRTLAGLRNDWALTVQPWVQPEESL